MYKATLARRRAAPAFFCFGLAGNAFQKKRPRSGPRSAMAHVHPVHGSEKVQEIEEIKLMYPNAYTRWTPDDDALLQDKFAQKVTFDELSRLFGRQPSAIQSRLAKLGLLPDLRTQHTSSRTSREQSDQSITNSPSIKRHELFLFVQVFCEQYRSVFGEQYWAGQKLILDLARGHRPNQKLQRAFEGVVEFFNKRGITISRSDIIFPSYIQYALETFKNEGSFACPAKLKNRVLLERYYFRPIPEMDPLYRPA